MSKKRKTVEILPILNWTNMQLKRTDEFATKEFKIGCCTILEKILHSANIYNGFMFNDSYDFEVVHHNTMQYWSREYFI